MKFLFVLVIFQQAFQLEAFRFAKCEPPCMIYGQCVDGNACECVKGYELVDLECKPRCNTGCMNGYCIAPEVCKCNAGYKSVGNACVVILVGYIKTTPSITTTASETTESSTSDSTETGLREVSAEGLIEGSTEESIEGSTEEFTVTETSETTAFTDTDTSSTLHDSLQIKVVVNNVSPLCNKQICGPNSFCVSRDKCDCLPGYSWQPNAEGEDGSCKLKLIQKKNEDIRVVPQEQKDLWTNNMFAVLGILCVTGAMLGLISGLYMHYT